jgi:predicted dinucleotide-binding enzyme
MDHQTIIVLGLIGFAVAVAVLFGISVALASRGNAAAAEANRKDGKPITNGFAIAATVAIAAIFVLALFLGVLPPLLRRG